MQDDNDVSSNPLSEDHLPVAGESQVRDDGLPLDPSEEVSSPPYQDDLDTDDAISDPIMSEETDDPTEELQVPPDELKEELDKYDVDNEGAEADDRREAIEDLDEGDDNSVSNA
jgi:hypothetical protein